MNPTNSSVSVVIPVYNQGDHIIRAVESALQQELPPSQVIVVNDGSDDGTVEALESLRTAKRLDVIHQERAGRSAARNRGIQESEGKWVAFLDADDYWFPSKLRMQLSLLEAGDCEFVYSGTAVVDDNGKFHRNRPVSKTVCLLGDLMWGNRLATPSVIVAKNLLEQTGGFDETLSVGEDWDLWLRLASAGRADCVPEPLVGVRRGDWDGSRYKIEDYEASVLKIMARFFASIQADARLDKFVRLQRQVWSWHYAVLAKSFFRNRNLSRALSYACRSLVSHPAGTRYLLPNAQPK